MGLFNRRKPAKPTPPARRPAAGQSGGLRRDSDSGADGIADAAASLGEAWGGSSSHDTSSSYSSDSGGYDSGSCDSGGGCDGGGCGGD
jgi:hypothetical protein